MSHRSPWPRRMAILAGMVAAVLGGVSLAALTTWRSKIHHPDWPAPEIRASSDPALIERGRYLVHGPAHCSQCHSTAERERPELVATAPLRGGLEFRFGPIGSTWARNLTPDAETGIGRRSDAELARALRSGVMPEGDLSLLMWASSARLSDEDIAAVLSYLRSMAPVRNEVPEARWTALGKVVVRLFFPDLPPRGPDGPAHVPAGPEPSVGRGAYLAEHVMHCLTCHTEFDMATFQPAGSKGAGGTPEPSHGADDHMEFAAPNLTAHSTGWTGKLDEDAFVARLRAGRTHRDSIMPWEGIQATSEADLRSVYRYLRTLPPVNRDTGPTYREIGWAPPVAP